MTYGRYFAPSGLRDAPRLYPPASAPSLGATGAPKPRPADSPETPKSFFSRGFRSPAFSPILLFISKDLHGQKTCRGPSRQHGGPNGDSHGHEGDPDAVPNAGMKRHVGHRVNLRVQRNHVKRAGRPGEGVSKAQTQNRTGGADGNALAQKDPPDLFPARAHGHEYGNVAGLVGYGHGKHHQNVQAGNKG